MATFFRIHSTIPNERPTLVITADAPAGSTGYQVLFSELFKTRKRAKEEKRRLKQLHQRGTHKLQEIVIEPGAAVLVEGKSIVVKEARAERARREIDRDIHL